MNTVLPRGKLTQYLLEYIGTQNFSVGDTTAPESGGWQGDMGEVGSVFIPYVVITPQNASAGTGSFGDSTEDYQVPYTLSHNGVSPRQVEDVSDSVRLVLSDLRRTDVVLNGISWRIQQVTNPSIGGITYSSAVDPTTYSQNDTVVLWISKNL